MATLQSIRDRAGILIAIIIGLAILAFVLGDFLGQGSSGIGMKKKLEIAEIAGESVSYLDFDKRINDLTEIYKLSGQTTIDEATVTSIRQQTWDQMVREFVMMKEYKKLGLSVSSDELFDLVQGENPHAYIRQIFTDPQTGIFDRGALIRFLKNLENDETGNQRKYWMFMEKQINDEKLFTKYLSLVRKGLYVTTLQAEAEIAENNKQVDFSYIIQRYSDVNDSTVSVSDEELHKYYNDHKDNYKQSASRDIEYIVFDVNPSPKDVSDSEEWINDIKSDFEETNDVAQFVNANSDIPYDYRNYKDGELPEVINDFMFSSEEGAVYGPYLENETYKLTRLTTKNMLPDSVRARHILISPSPERSPERSKQVADSLKNLIDTGVDFALLATLNSDDQGSAQLGGDLGWFTEGSMVKPFNDASFYGKKGDITVIESQFGFHIIEILDQGPKVNKVQVGILARTIQPSSNTYQNIYSEASRFAGTNNTNDKFISAIEEGGLNKRVANDIKEGDRQIPGLESPRFLIRAVYENKKGSIVLDQNNQAVFELDDKFVVAYLTDVKEEGIATFEQVKEDVKLNAVKKKKAESLIKTLNEKMAGVNTLDDLAGKIKTNVQEATDINFNSFSVPGAGIEPDVIGTVVNLSENVISKPIEGLNGVYVVQVTAVTEGEGISSETEKNNLISIYQNRVNFETYNALLENANVKDKRAKFY